MKEGREERAKEGRRWEEGERCGTHELIASSKVRVNGSL